MFTPEANPAWSASTESRATVVNGPTAQRHAKALHDQHGLLAACKSLEGTTIPNGQKYEDWL